MNNKVTIKFILKCLFQKDDVTSIIFQIEATPQHHYYFPWPGSVLLVARAIRQCRTRAAAPGKCIDL